jgi:flagellar protein FlaG
MALGPIDSRTSVVLPQTERPAVTPRAPAGQGVASDPKATNAVANPSEQLPAAQEEARREDVESAVKRANHVVQVSARDLEFTVDDASGRTVVKVIDKQTNEVIRQIPSDEMLAIAESIERLQGLLVKQQA